jgi:CxxH/CxxC protein (TIGR04129 family)
MLYACTEHIDEVMEDFIDEYSVAPTLEKIDLEQHHCAWCDQPAVYRLEVEEPSDAD